MIKIIKKGTIKNRTCKKCGCIFSYEKEDVKIEEDIYGSGSYYYIDCPQCTNRFYIEPVGGRGKVNGSNC